MKCGAATISPKLLLAVLVVGVFLSSCSAQFEDVCSASKTGDRVRVAGVFATDGYQSSVFEAANCPQRRFGLLLDGGDRTVSEFDDAVLKEAIKVGGSDRHYRLELSGRYLNGHGAPDGVIEVFHIVRWEPVRVEHLEVR